MEITPAQLVDQWQGVPVLVKYVWASAENRMSMPMFMLAAVASRETNMQAQYWQGTVGDNGHGHGSFQLDDRYHSIPNGFDTSPVMQAEAASNQLTQLHRQFNNWPQALAAYNSGSPNDLSTTHHDYGADVFSRYLTLAEHFDQARVLRLTAPYMKGPDVSFWQTAMNMKRYSGTPLVVDGVYGPKTATVVANFQLRVGIPLSHALDPLTLAEMGAN